MFFVSQLSGEISTKPLLNIIAKTSSQFSWLGILINIFIMASITVSFVTVGTAMKHVLDGFVCSLTVKLKATAGTFLKDFVINLHINWKNGIVYFFFFGLVLLLAQIFPKGFFLHFTTCHEPCPKFRIRCFCVHHAQHCTSCIFY